MHGERLYAHRGDNLVNVSIYLIVVSNLSYLKVVKNDLHSWLGFALLGKNVHSFPLYKLDLAVGMQLNLLSIFKPILLVLFQ